MNKGSFLGNIFYAYMWCVATHKNAVCILRNFDETAVLLSEVNTLIDR